MKKRIKLVTTCLLATFVFAGAAAGQSESTQLNLNRQIRLNGDSMIEEISVKIEEKTERFFLKINSNVEAGKLTIELRDPNGEKHGNFSVGSQIESDNSTKENKNSKKERVSAQINKSIQNPVVGNWKIKITPIKAKGAISISSKQMYEGKSKE